MNIEKYYDLIHNRAKLESNYAHMADLRDSALKELDEAQERIAELEKQLENSVIAPYDKHGNQIKVGDWVQWGNGKTKDPFEVICLKPDGDGIVLNDKSFESCWRPDYAGYWEIVPEPDTIEKIVYNPPHTIVQWKDGQSIRVTCSPEDTYSKELGLAYCLAKKLLGQGWYRKLTECEIVDLTQKAIMFEPLEPKVFDWNEFLSGKTAVRCEGKKQVEAFVKMRKKQNSYPSGMSAKEHAARVIRGSGENIIFTAAGFNLISAKSLYEAQGYKVIPFSSVRDWGMR